MDEGEVYHFLSSDHCIGCYVPWKFNLCSFTSEAPLCKFCFSAHFL